MEWSMPRATSGRSPIVTNSVVPMAKPPVARASRARATCGVRAFVVITGAKDSAVTAIPSGGSRDQTRPMLPRTHWQRHIATLDPDRDYEEIYRLMIGHEFPWDMTQALSFALFRTYAVPSIGRLLDETGELEHRTQKRYDDTALLLDEPALHGLRSDRGRRAIRRINLMHGAYPISADEMRY